MGMEIWDGIRMLIADYVRLMGEWELGTRDEVR
jgi:hypothetical protein